MTILFLGLIGVREGKMMSIYGVYAWRKGLTKIVASVFVGLTGAYAKRKVGGNSDVQLAKCIIHLIW